MALEAAAPAVGAVEVAEVAEVAEAEAEDEAALDLLPGSLMEHVWQKSKLELPKTHVPY